MNETIYFRKASRGGFDENESTENDEETDETDEDEENAEGERDEGNCLFMYEFLLFLCINMFLNRKIL